MNCQVADRIDHGVRAIEDPVLLQMPADRQIPLGVCLTSNLVLGVYPSIEEHLSDCGELVYACL